MAAETSTSKTPVRITIDDFMTGLLAGLAARGVKVVTITDSDFYEAVVEVFNTLERRAAEQGGIDLRFWLMVDEIHGDSPDIRDSITSAQQRRLVSLDNPTFENMRLKLSSATDATPYLESLPGGADLYLDLADEFKHLYRAYA
jgi:hypothetical protein